jgi:hypothetical protein
VQPKKYRETKAISQSVLKAVAKSPRKFEAYQNGTMEFEPTDAMDLGSLVDSMLLTPGEVGEYFVEVPESVLAKNGRRSGGKWDAFEEANAGKVLLKSAAFETAHLVVERIKQHPFWLQLCEKGFVTQKECYWMDPMTGLPCKCLIDIFPRMPATNDWLADLKTTENMDTFEAERFQMFRDDKIGNDGILRSKSVLDFGYHVQGAWYSRGASLATECVFQRFFLLVAEVKPPYRVKAFKIADEALLLGQMFVDKAMDGLSERLLKNDFSELGENEVVTISVPEWAFK